jgi:hypothetical protein
MDQRKTNPGRMSIVFLAVREALTLATPPMRAISVPVAREVPFGWRSTRLQWHDWNLNDTMRVVQLKLPVVL